MFKNFKFRLGKSLVTFSFNLTRFLINLAATLPTRFEERGWKLIARNCDDVPTISEFAKAHYAKLGIRVEVYDSRKPETLEAIQARDDEELNDGRPRARPNYYN